MFGDKSFDRSLLEPSLLNAGERVLRPDESLDATSVKPAS